MKRNFRKILLLAMPFLVLAAITGCAPSEITSPEDAIIDAYGDKKFRISFDSEELEDPITDIYYTAKNMPQLPTPKKVGYVFAGWFFDKSLTDPCDVDNGDLLWKMKNVTLYPKWEEEQIFNNGTYEIEYNARIVEDSIAKGILAEKYGYQKFPENIVASETYIEKNDKGTFLRIQYDNVVRGPVLGSAGSDENNFSKQTYTVTDSENRINKDISILDRTSNIQTIYYDISDKSIRDTFRFTVEYYNWKDPIPDEQRKNASVVYDVEFKITRFIGFNQPFINPEGHLSNGLYVVPTHYQNLNKATAMLDMFNPVYTYLEANNGHYTLHKQLNSYNNDSPTMTTKLYPLRTSGYSREFACFKINNDIRVSEEIENDMTGEYYMPEELEASKYIPITYEFHADTGRYYYTIDLGESLDQDLVFIGGSSGAMEQMFSFPFNYRRLTIDYNNMVKITESDYKPLRGEEFTYKKEACIYPGSFLDFKNDNTDFDIYQKYRNAIEMTNVFFTQTKSSDEDLNVDKVFDTKMVISPSKDKGNHPRYSRYNYAFFDIQYSAFDYNPISDGELLGRDLSFITNGFYRCANSSFNKKIIGKSFNIGDSVSLEKLYREYVADDASVFEYKAYKMDENLNVDFNSEINVEKQFNFSENLAILFTAEANGNNRSSLVRIAKREKLSPYIVGEGYDWTMDTENPGLYKTDKRFLIGEKGDEIQVPEVRYKSYGSYYSTRSLKKYDEDDFTTTDFTRVSAWEYLDGTYKAISMNAGGKFDFYMPSEKVRALVQLTNPFGEFETIMFEFRGTEAGEYEIKLGNNILASGDLRYKGNKLLEITHSVRDTIDIVSKDDINKLPSFYDLIITKDSSVENLKISFDRANVYLKNTTIEVTNINDLWNYIKDEPYALIYLYYSDARGDKISLKAQYNFKINTETLDKYYFVDKNQTVFTNDSFKFRVPILTSADFKQLAYSSIDVYKKAGNNFILATNEEANSYDSDNLFGYVEFKKNGTYLLLWKFTLKNDLSGHPIFDIFYDDELVDGLTFTLGQEIDVVDRNTPITITYVTDKAHPFNMENPKLEGFEFSEDDKYQYMKIGVSNTYNSFSLTQDCFIIDPASKDILFEWTNKQGKTAIRPGYMLRDIAVEMGTINPVVYAHWDPGIYVNVKYEQDGVLHEVGDYYFKRNPDTGGGYIVFFSSLAFNVPKGYVLYGWRASKAIFTYQETVDGEIHTIHSNFLKSEKPFKGNVVLYNKVDFVAVLKKTTYVQYEAYDEVGEKLDFMKKLKTDFGLHIGDSFNDVISNEKLKELSRVSVENKRFLYWTAFDKEQNKWIKVDLDTLILEERFTDAKGRITLRAIFG